MIDEDKEEIAKKQRRERRLRRRIFGVSLIVLNVGVSVMYAMLDSTPMYVLNINSVINAIFIMLLAIIGFGLHLAFLKHLVWTSLGFSLLITAITLELYPLVNALWGKLNISGRSLGSFSNNTFSLYLASMDGNRYDNNTITGAAKCAISLIIAFASVIGRVGRIQVLVMVVIGVCGFSLNQAVVNGIGQDLFGTFSVFAFGGFLGLVFGMLTTKREKQRNAKTNDTKILRSNEEALHMCLLGNLAIFVLLPYLAYEGDQSRRGTAFQHYIGPLTIILSMGTAITTSVISGMLIHGDKAEGNLRIMDMLNAQIAGGIASGAASYYATSPFQGVICGFVAAIFQYFFDNVLERRVFRRWGVVSTYSFSLFCLQSLIGAIFAFIYKATASSGNSSIFVIPDLSLNGAQFECFFISAGLGSGCGFIIGLLSYLFKPVDESQLFHDKSQFLQNDGIRRQLQGDSLGTKRRNVPYVVVSTGGKGAVRVVSKMKPKPKKPPVQLTEEEKRRIQEQFYLNNVQMPQQQQYEIIEEIPNLSEFDEPQSVTSDNSFDLNDLMSEDMV